MAPLLEAGDEVAVEAIKPIQLQVGDIVVMDEDPGFLTHRYWGTDGLKLVTRGDRTLTFDPLWEPDRLLGRISARRRDGATLSLERGPGAWLANHLGQVAALELRACGGYAAKPLSAPASPTHPGKKMAQNGRNLPGRLLRRGFRAWCTAIAFLLAPLGTVARSKEANNAGKRL
jgi:hypothetical protein